MSELGLSCPQCTGRAWSLVLEEPNQWRCCACLWVSRIGSAGVMELIPTHSIDHCEFPDDRRASLSEWEEPLGWSEANRLICGLVHRSRDAS